jgi:hypothetical protein
VRVTTREGDLVFSESFETTGGGGSGRSLGLLGGGFAFVPHPRCTIIASGVTGFDVVTGGSVSVMPVLGARVGVEWAANFGLVRFVQLSVTGASDLTRTENAFHQPLGGTMVSVGTTVGFAVLGH